MLPAWMKTTLGSGDYFYNCYVTSRILLAATRTPADRAYRVIPSTSGCKQISQHPIFLHSQNKTHLRWIQMRKLAVHTCVAAAES